MADTPEDLGKLPTSMVTTETIGQGRKEKTVEKHPSSVPAQVQLPMRELDKQSVINNLELTLNHLIMDVLKPLNISAPKGASVSEREFHKMVRGMAVYPVAEERIYALCTRLPLVLLNYFLYPYTYYSHIQINGIDVIVDSEPKQDAEGNFWVEIAQSAGTHLKYPIKKSKDGNHIKSFKVRGAGSSALMEELASIFELRSQVLRGLKNVAKHSHKAVIKVPGLTTLMAETRKDKTLFEGVKQDINRQTASMFGENDLILVDAGVQLGTFEMNIPMISSQIDFIYGELARLLQIPKTKLLGEAPGGLNATGAYDYQNYQDTLEAIRMNVLYPFLEGMEIHYSVDRVHDLAKVGEAVQLLSNAENTLSGLTVAALQELYQATLGSRGLDMVSDENINAILVEDKADDEPSWRPY
jgi:Protein of unknown function (DUF1073)